MMGMLMELFGLASGKKETAQTVLNKKMIKWSFLQAKKEDDNCSNNLNRYIYMSITGFSTRKHDQHFKYLIDVFHGSGPPKLEVMKRNGGRERVRKIFINFINIYKVKY